jgi:hypothetical protein
MCAFPHRGPRGALKTLADGAALGRKAVGTHSGDRTASPSLPFGPAARRARRRSLRSSVRAFIAAILLAQMGWGSTGARAAEFAQSTYLLGLGSSLAGLTPPPGFYFQADNYFYDGKIGGGRQVSFGPAVGVNVRQDTWLSIPTGLLVTPVNVLGGNLAFAMSVPVGTPRVNPTIQVDFPRLGRTAGTSITESRFDVGDFYMQSFIGWHKDDFHWQLGVLGVGPSGSYKQTSFSNVSLNRPALDAFGAFTWLSSTTGQELSAKAGVTFNGTNTINDYRTGNEFHLEWAAMQHFSPSLAVGLVGYYYDQISGDSGRGAKLGAFEGRVAALGGEVDVNFKLGELPVSSKFRVYREFAAENRFEGTVGILTLAVPLSVPSAQQAARSVSTRN